MTEKLEDKKGIINIPFKNIPKHHTPRINIDFTKLINSINGNYQGEISCKKAPDRAEGITDFLKDRLPDYDFQFINEKDKPPYINFSYNNNS